MRTLLLFLALLAELTLSAQTSHSFNMKEHQQEGFSVVNSTDTALTLHYAIAEIGINDIDNGQAKGHEIVLKGRFGSQAEGMPSLPFDNRYIAVPQGAKVVVEIKENASTTLQGIDLLPAAPEQVNAGVGLPVLRKDPAVFGKDADFPSENAVIAQSTRIRGLDVVLLHLTPFRYNPVRKTLEVLHDIDINIRFEGGNGQFGEARYRNPAWDGILRDLVINPDRLPKAHYEALLNEALEKREEACEYLIISPDDDYILSWADTLKRFRTRQGIPTKVVTTTECGGNDAETIKAYIQHAYEHWTIPPAAVMLFSGLVDTVVSNYMTVSDEKWGIPGFPLLFIGYDNGYYLVNHDYFSDNPYADMNGDSIPDLALSRLPALTPSDYQTQVRKLLRYETNPPTDQRYYDEPLITSGYEDNKWFLITSQCANGFLRQKLGRHPKNYYMVYNYSGMQEEPDSLWSTGYNTETVVDYFGPSGQNYIAQDPDTLNSWRDMEDNTYLVETLNRSSFLTLYRDHSASDLWCCPWFESSQIDGLTSKHPTFVLSIGCNTALYYLTKWSQGYYESPIIHTFCNHESGAVGGIGSTTVTFSHFNDMLTCGVIDYIWPDFMPGTGSSTSQEFIRPCYALVAGKLFLNQQAFLPAWWPEKVTTTHNVFHYLGDAYLNLFTEVPQPLHIEASSYHTDYTWDYLFTTEAGATVCLSNDEGIIAVTKATGQPQSISLPPSAPGDRFLLTATKQNRYRAEQAITVIAADQPYVHLEEAFINDYDGNGQLDYGETASFDILLGNKGLYASQGGQITLECESPHVEILQNTARYTTMEPNTSTLIENAFRIILSANATDLETVVFKVRVNDAANSHTDPFNAVLHAPILTLIPDFRISQSDGEPSTHILTEGKTRLTFQINNEGHSPSRLTALSMRLKAPFVSLDTAVYLHENLQPGDTALLTFTTNADGSVTDPAWLQTQIHLQHNDIEFVKDTILQYGGLFENFESDTLNPYFTRRNHPGHPWNYSYEDAYEGQRCYESGADIGNTGSYFRAMVYPYLDHNSKVSFRYQTSRDETLKFVCKQNEYQYLNAEGWHYAEANYAGDVINFTWTYIRNDSLSAQAKVDDICFPPPHRAIASAGPDFPWCRETPVELRDAYAYDCQSLRWTTDGDGHFEYDSIVNPVYFAGSGDLANGGVTLTLSAFSNDTIVSSVQIRFVDDIAGDITGDSVVNVYQQPISHYATDYEPGLAWHWQIEPAEAGFIYAFGHETDILWNQHEGITEATLSVTTENGCATAPATKLIRLVGHATPEGHPMDFLLYPNPTQGLVTLVAGETLTGKATVEVFNLLGERMMLKNIGQITKDQPIHLDLRHLVNGLYLIRLQTRQGSVTKKVSLIY